VSAASPGLLGVCALALAGGSGAAARVLVDAAVAARLRGATLRVVGGTLLVNAAGSLLLGVLTGLALRTVTADPAPAAAPLWLLVLGTGFCGAFTTFGTPCWQAVQLLAERRWGPAAAVTAGNLALSAAGAAVGLVLVAP
jgi:CrcB protein